MDCFLCASPANREVGVKNGCRLVRCAACGLIFTDPLPEAGVIDAYYDSYYANQKNIRNAAWKVRRFKRRIRPLTWLTRGRDFLDVGCNIGFGVEAARRLGFRATGLDLSREAIEIAQGLYPENTFHNLAANEFVASGKQFDLLLCCEIIEHLTEIHPFMAALAGLVRPEGLLYLTTPDAGHFRVPRNFLSWKEVIPPEHLVFFNKRLLARLLERHGFRPLFFQPMLKANIRVLARRHVLPA